MAQFCPTSSIGGASDLHSRGRWFDPRAVEALFLHDIWPRTLSLMVICISSLIQMSCGIRSHLRINWESLVSYLRWTERRDMTKKCWNGVKPQTNKRTNKIIGPAAPISLSRVFSFWICKVVKELVSVFVV